MKGPVGKDVPNRRSEGSEKLRSSNRHAEEMAEAPKAPGRPEFGTQRAEANPEGPTRHPMALVRPFRSTDGTFRRCRKVRQVQGVRHAERGKTICYPSKWLSGERGGGISPMTPGDRHWSLVMKSARQPFLKPHRTKPESLPTQTEPFHCPFSGAPDSPHIASYPPIQWRARESCSSGAGRIRPGQLAEVPSSAPHSASCRASVAIFPASSRY